MSYTEDIGDLCIFVGKTEASVFPLLCIRALGLTPYILSALGLAPMSVYDIAHFWLVYILLSTLVVSL